jgi:CubicO group peptidase (beta-lactamase class C family)
MYRKTYSLTVLILTAAVLSAVAQNQWPTKGWQRSTPQAVGLNADSLAFLDKELASGKYGYIDGMLIIRHGKVAYEKSYKHDYSSIYKEESIRKGPLNASDPTGPYNYFNPWWHPFLHDSKLHTLQSVSKTITSVIIGTALARNEFPDLNTHVLSFFDTSLIKNIDARKRNITIRHLLTMTAGMNWNENLPYTDPNNSGMIMEASFDWVKYTIDRPMADEPGTVFKYNSGATQILAYIFKVATGVDIEEYAVKHLFEPLGIKNYYWKRSPSGLVDAEGGVYLEKGDLAKIFYLYLRKGEWDGKEIVKPEWIKQSVTPFITISPGVSYGYKWWLYTYENNGLGNVWAGNGFGGQLPMIIPEYDMVMVFTGWNILPGKPSLGRRFVLEKVLGAITEYKKEGKYK